jgi:hypothetical protein
MESMSQLSISQETVTKKSKHSTTEATVTSSEIIIEPKAQSYTFYKPSKYLKMPRRLLLHSLHLQLNCSLKKKKEQRFLLARLRIIDEQFCVEQIRSLYQTYFDSGAQYRIWPVSFTIMPPIFILSIDFF